MDIKNSYLMWVGKEHYEGIDVYSTESVTLGVSKRLPNAAVGKALMEPGTVVFIAHDEGEHTDCPKCKAVIECPDCRKRNEQVVQLNAAIDKVKARFDDFEAEAPKGQKRFVATREAKIAKLQTEIGECTTCEGMQQVEAGTGGHVVLKDGTTWDYRKYMYWRNQPKKWDFRKEVKETHMCPECGGFGQLPEGKVFGMFLPERLEYILGGDDDEKVKEALEGVKTKLVDGPELKKEVKRGCGRRKAGGVYVVTSPKSRSKKAKKLAEELVAKGIVDGTEVHGMYVKFTSPISIDAKRFRGIKRWSLDPVVEDEAEMAGEALED